MGSDDMVRWVSATATDQTLAEVVESLIIEHLPNYEDLAGRGGKRKG